VKRTTTFLFLAIFLFSCNFNKGNDTSSKALPMTGTWKLLKGTLQEKGNTSVTDYTKNISFIKIINDTHFAFLQHDMKNGKDSAVFVAGGGRYSLKDSSYTEHLEYCSAREWEGHDFNFTVTIHNDTMISRGVEKVPSAGIDRTNTEEYVRIH
jgi:hypothetical protein